MFELPNAKRVRREDLYDAESDAESSGNDELDSSIREKLNAQLSGLLDISFAADDDGPAPKQETQQITGQNDGPEDVGDDAGPPEEEAFMFRLFRDEDLSHTVVIAPQDGPEQKGDGGFVVPKRPQSYYLATEPSPELIEQFRQAAVSAGYLLADSKKRRWGLEKPWKVTAIPAGDDKSQQLGITGKQSADSTEKKKRPGKKRRIILRVREKAKKEQAEKAKQQLVDKEQHLKDKKARLNRERKLKRRAKEREKKQAANGGVAPGDTGMDDDAGS
ncbi:hypothetical protein F4780DRAFT_725624, partial [Xylariomycetidae sp. FL0641]